MTVLFFPQRHPDSAIAMSSHAQENAKSVERGAIQPQLMRRLPRPLTRDSGPIDQRKPAAPAAPSASIMGIARRMAMHTMD